MVEYADYITRRANDTKCKTRTESKLFCLLLALKLLFFFFKGALNLDGRGTAVGIEKATGQIAQMTGTARRRERRSGSKINKLCRSHRSIGYSML